MLYHKRNIIDSEAPIMITGGKAQKGFRKEIWGLPEYNFQMFFFYLLPLGLKSEASHNTRYSLWNLTPISGSARVPSDKMMPSSSWSPHDLYLTYIKYQTQFFKN